MPSNNDDLLQVWWDDLKERANNSKWPMLLLGWQFKQLDPRLEVAKRQASEKIQAIFKELSEQFPDEIKEGYAIPGISVQNPNAPNRGLHYHGWAWIAPKSEVLKEITYNERYYLRRYSLLSFWAEMPKRDPVLWVNYNMEHFYRLSKRSDASMMDKRRPRVRTLSIEDIIVFSDSQPQPKDKETNQLEKTKVLKQLREEKERNDRRQEQRKIKQNSHWVNKSYAAALLEASGDYRVPPKVHCFWRGKILCERKRVLLKAYAKRFLALSFMDRCKKCNKRLMFEIQTTPKHPLLTMIDKLNKN